jgi:hypothetical protein
MALELTPKEIDARNTRAAIDDHLGRTMAGMDWEPIVKAALKEHPPVFRKTEPVSEGVRKVQVEAAKRRQTKTRKHILP